MKIPENNHLQEGIIKNRTIRPAYMLLLGTVIGFLASYGWASMTAPTEHKGLDVAVLGSVPSDSISAQVGLDDKQLLLRKITIAPGGQIAKHSHSEVPGVVYMVSGSWIEGREDGEVEHTQGDTFIEDKDTVHWFYNRGEEPASAIVCDIKPAG